MSDELKKHPITLEDGRKAERIVQAGEEGKTITELWVEPQIEKRLSQRVVEYTKPVVHRREVEVVDEHSGEVVERKVESLEPEVKMQLREVIKSEGSVQAMSVKEDPCDCHVTREEMMDGLLTVVAALQNKSVSAQNVENTQVSMQSVVGERIATAEAGSDNKVGIVLWTAIAALSAILLSTLFGG